MYSFRIKGHSNVLATHRNTLEFTKDDHLTPNGDCIIGVKADFDLNKLVEFLKFPKIKITIKCGIYEDALSAIPNKKFSSNKEMVVRLGEFESQRTLATRADKSAVMLNRNLIGELKKGHMGQVQISKI